jgi:NADH-quinone oxidoreductase subunit B
LEDNVDKEIEQGYNEVLESLRKRSLFMLHYCTGCGAVELPPTMTSRYDMERFGIVPYVTPRQSDILIVTGYVNIKTLRRIITTYEQMLDPKYVIGFGSCTINGGIYWDSHSVIKKLDPYIPVDLYIAGCMPRPEAIIHSFKHLMELIDTGKANGYKQYKENYDFYRENQRKVLGEWR